MANYKEKYGKTLGLIKSPTDPRDYNFSDVLACAPRVKIPDNYIQELPPFIYDQGNSSMCCACAYSTIRYIQESKKDQSELTEPLSPCFTYGNRNPMDIYEGMLLRNCAKKGREGSVLFSELPHFCSVQKAVKYVKERKDELLEKAESFRISSFYTAKTKEEIQRGIMETGAVLTGIPVYECFYTPDEEGRIIYDPETCGENFGGHAQVYFCWRTDENGKVWFGSINSWGDSWGKNGMSWIPEDYPLMDDAYILVDEVTDTKFKEYKEKFYGKE